MTQIHIHVAGAVASAEKEGVVTCGMVGIPVTFHLGPEWEGLVLTAVFEAGGEAREKKLEGNTTQVPWEVLQTAGPVLMIGLEGRDEAGSLVIPTTWARVGVILNGAKVNGNPALEPTPSQFERIMARLETVETQAGEASAQAAGAVAWNTSQALTDAAKNQARQNIGAVPAPQTAAVGQTVAVTAVDESGKPAAWAAVDMPPVFKSRRELFSLELTEQVDIITVSPTAEQLAAIQDANQVLIQMYMKSADEVSVTTEDTTASAGTAKVTFYNSGDTFTIEPAVPTGLYGWCNKCYCGFVINNTYARGAFSSLLVYQYGKRNSDGGITSTFPNKAWPRQVLAKPFAIELAYPAGAGSYIKIYGLDMAE